MGVGLHQNCSDNVILVHVSVIQNTTLREDRIGFLIVFKKNYLYV